MISRRITNFEIGYQQLALGLCREGLTPKEDELTVALEQAWLPRDHDLNYEVLVAAMFDLGSDLRVAIRIDRRADLRRLVLLVEESPNNQDAGARIELHWYQAGHCWRRVIVRGKCSSCLQGLADRLNIDVSAPRYGAMDVGEAVVATTIMETVSWAGEKLAA